ncbi:DUF3072 domain-containing protein [Corynebacterium sp. P6129]|uniref:DUF3072 domain-containing protein n=1 Tax=Corynebacterium antarcticum TaxID=2800405 RepID=UPI002260CFF1|nr:DUF3072 domain-containing protein [Corynebacterium antarcticum]MCX7491455.1 DUF3072 domain-containing protein [Corynebacterium antarcticum]
MRTITPKQQAFIRALAIETGATPDGLGGMYIQGSHASGNLLAAVDGECSSYHASQIIDTLLCYAPEGFTARPSADAPATGRQISYIESLAKKAGREVDTTGLTKAAASKLIEELKTPSPAAA